MAALIRSNPQVQVFRFGELQEKIMLYTDDTMLLLGDTSDSLKAAMSIIVQFGRYSGLVINWTKSSLMVLDADPDAQDVEPLQIPLTSSFKCLGIQITPKILEYIPLTCHHYLDKFVLGLKYGRD